MPVFAAIGRMFTPSDSDNQSGAQYNEQANAASQLTARLSPKVDPKAGQNNMNNLGRAALISTSPQGVEGTSPTNRYKLLGNSSGLGNN